MQIKFSDEVAAAMGDGNTGAGAVVGLESTVFSHHGLPLPERREVLQKTKEVVKGKGAVPAITILIDGILYVGTTPAQEEELLTSESAQKMSLRDIPVAMAQGWKVGATTVSATLAIAHNAGIKIMATGGIGGVHRGNAGDISTDLYALARYPLGVVCSGAKGFLDLPRTLELLETLGVPVIGYGTDTFPAFWCESSGLPVPQRMDTAEAAVKLIRALQETGAVIGLPVPSEMALDKKLTEKSIKVALKKAKRAGIVGAASTPFILKQINQASQAQSLVANLALLENNASLAGEIASQLQSS